MRWTCILSVCVLFFPTIAAFADSKSEHGLVAEWNFDEESGDVAKDSSGNHCDAKLHGGTRIKQGKGWALAFDGKESQYADFGSTASLGLGGPVTLEMWIKPTAQPSGETTLLGEGMKTFVLNFAGGGVCYWYVGHGDVSSYASAKLTIGEWQHLAATFDGTHIGLWINGREVASKQAAVTSYTPSGSFVIGMSGAAANLPRFEGLIDNVRVYNRAIPEAESVAHMQVEGAQYGMVIQTAVRTSLAESTRFFENHAKPTETVEQGYSILIANDRVGIEFCRTGRGFQIGRLYGIAEKQDYLVGDAAVGFRNLFEVMMTLDPKKVGRDERHLSKPGLFGIIDEMAGDSFPVGSHAAASVSWRKEGNDKESSLHFEWRGIDVREDKGVLDVDVTVTLRAGDPLTYWRISLRNRSPRYGVERVRFPILSLIPIGKAENNVFIYPKGRGGLVENPFAAPGGFGLNYHTQGGLYPHYFNMQFQALYDKSSGSGIFLGTRDPAASLMSIQIANTPSQITWAPGHFPPNVGYSEEDFKLSYDCVAGPFRGDWYDACQMYREWALQQPWSRKGPLTKRQDIPKWYKESPLYFYTHLQDSIEGTFSLEENMTIAADHLMQFVQWAGMPLGATFYGWKEYHPDQTTYTVPFNTSRATVQGRWAGMPMLNAHDGNYPKIPAIKNFAAATKRLRDAGGMVSPYLCVEIFDQGASENSPYAAEAKPNIIRDLYGSRRCWGSETAWQPCCHTQWFRNRMTETCILMLDRENVSGFYMDTLRGGSLPCYWPPHGHSAGGGNSSTVAKHDLVRIVRDAVKAKNPDAIITGEDPAENMMDVIDGMLNSTLFPDYKAFLFATVYQDYIKRYGLQLNLGRGDDFFIECASLFTEGAQIGMLTLRPRPSLSFQKPEHKEMLEYLDRFVGYYRNENTRDFLAYGQLMRPIEIQSPLLPYAGGGEFPAIMNGVFRIANGEVAIFIVNASKMEQRFQTKLDPTRHGIPEGRSVTVEMIAPDGAVSPISNGAAPKGTISLEAMLPAHGLTMFHLKPAA